ncbi:hypothetical protein Nepgr_004720 [Nepenthes gracilis]|uniref:Uncharacterized protein n=1 Tax=Nepenthes gracilis TaxID=150966 RepID=A0AAD3XFP7_NEPGR|nr:hypothetical protein Nepgr_004720 [Nepenthes gracilis]
MEDQVLNCDIELGGGGSSAISDDDIEIEDKEMVDTLFASDGPSVPRFHSPEAAAAAVLEELFTFQRRN